MALEMPNQPQNPFPYPPAAQQRGGGLGGLLSGLGGAAAGMTPWGAALGGAQLLGAGLFGSGPTTTTSNQTSTTGFDQSQLPFLMKALGMSDKAGEKLRKQLEAQAAKQQELALANFDKERQAYQGLFGQAYQENAATTQARRNAAMGSSLMRQNSTVGRGMAALEGREGAANAARIRAQEQGVLGGLYGRQGGTSNQIQAGLGQQLAALGNQRYGLQSLLAQKAAGSTKSNTQSRNTSRTKGFLWS